MCDEVFTHPVWAEANRRCSATGGRPEVCNCCCQQLGVSIAIVFAIAILPGLFRPGSRLGQDGPFLDLRHRLQQDDHAHVRGAGCLCCGRIGFEDLRTEDQQS